MRAACCICSDILDEIQPVSAAACGHVYHAKCLLAWIGHSKTCPVCRTRVRREHILRLYFEFPSVSALNSSVLENEVSNLKAQLSAKDIELDALKKQKENTVVFVREAEKISADLQQALYKSESDIAELKLRVKSAGRLEAKVLKLESMNTTLTNDLQLLNNVQSIVSGTQKDVNDMLREYGSGSEASKQIATYCTILKRELQNIIESKSKLKEQNSRLKQENCRFAAKVKFYEDAMAIPNGNDSILPEKISTSVKGKENFNEINYGASTSKTPTAVETMRSSNFDIIDITPLSVPFSKSKFSRNIIASSNIIHKSEVNIEKCTGISSVTVTERNDDDSIIRTGYNGLGGHVNFINKGYGIKKFRSLKRK